MWKVSIFGVFLVLIFPHLYWMQILCISPYSVRMRESTDQKTSKYGHFPRCAHTHCPIKFRCHGEKVKVKTWFFTFLNVYIFPNWTGQNIIISLLPPPKSRYFPDQNGPRGDTPWKWILTIFKWKNEFPKQLGFENQMKKMGSFLSGFHVSFLRYGPYP